MAKQNNPIQDTNDGRASTFNACLESAIEYCKIRKPNADFDDILSLTDKFFWWCFKGFPRIFSKWSPIHSKLIGKSAAIKRAVLCYSSTTIQQQYPNILDLADRFVKSIDKYYLNEKGNYGPGEESTTDSESPTRT